MTDFSWQCLCGNIEYSDAEPDECLKCGKIGSFTQLPEELMDERMKMSMEDDLEEEFEDEIEQELIQTPKIKNKDKTKKPGSIKKPKKKKRK